MVGMGVMGMVVVMVGMGVIGMVVVAFVMRRRQISDDLITGDFLNLILLVSPRVFSRHDCRLSFRKWGIDW